jgi:hypothetical protein
MGGRCEPVYRPRSAGPSRKAVQFFSGHAGEPRGRLTPLRHYAPTQRGGTCRSPVDAADRPRPRLTCWRGGRALRQRLGQHVSGVALTARFTAHCASLCSMPSSGAPYRKPQSNLVCLPLIAICQGELSRGGPSPRLDAAARQSPLGRTQGDKTQALSPRTAVRVERTIVR